MKDLKSDNLAEIYELLENYPDAKMFTLMGDYAGGCQGYAWVSSMSVEGSDWFGNEEGPIILVGDENGQQYKDRLTVKDLLEMMEKAELNGALYAISEIHLEHVTVLESKEDRQAYKWSYNTHKSPGIREFPTVVLDWWFGKI